MTSRQPVFPVPGETHASSVMPVVRFSSVLLATVTRELVPLKTSACPNLPFGVHVALLMVPALPRPDASLATVPVPSSNEYALTRFGLVDIVVALATLEYGPRLP